MENERNIVSKRIDIITHAIKIKRPNEKTKFNYFLPIQLAYDSQNENTSAYKLLIFKIEI